MYLVYRQDSVGDAVLVAFLTNPHARIGRNEG